MIQKALTCRTESDDEEPLAKVGRKRNAGIRRVGIELPPLNTALVEVHRELARTTIGAKDMATKNKIVWKTVKRTKEELQKANARIAELELGITAASQLGESTDNTDAPQALREELEAWAAITAKAKKAAQLAQSEIDRLRSELRQSSDRETDI